MVDSALSSTRSLTPAASVGADRGGAVDAHVQMQAVVLEQHRRRRSRLALVA
jgi:hypothetical protein